MLYKTNLMLFFDSDGRWNWSAVVTLEHISEKNLMLNFRLRGIPKVENRVDYDYALIFMRTSCGFGTARASKKNVCNFFLTQHFCDRFFASSRYDHERFISAVFAVQKCRVGAAHIGILLVQPQPRPIIKYP